MVGRDRACPGNRIALHVAWWSPWNAPLWLLLLTVGLFLAGRSQRPIRTLALLLAGYVVGASLAWIWVRADEARFAQEVIHDPQATRARWWPYSAVAWLSRGEDGGIVATD